MSTIPETQKPVGCLYSIERTAELLAISPWTVRKWISERRIETCKIGARRLIPSSEVARIISDATVRRDSNSGERQPASRFR